MENNIKINTKEFNFKSFLFLLVKHQKFLLLLVLLFCGFAILITTSFYFIKNPTQNYTAESIVEIETENKNSNVKTTYLSILSSETIKKLSIADLVLEHDDTLLLVDVNEQSKSDIIKLTVSYPNKTQVLQITNSIINESIILANDTLKGIKVVSREHANIVSSNSIKKALPNIALILIVSAILGAIFGIFIVLFVDAFFDKISTQLDIEAKLGIPVLTTLPIVGKQEKLGWCPWKKKI